jgi:arylsulfatase A-like enzyme
MVERDVRFVTVNMFETVFNEITWDIHGSAPFSPISCYRDLIGPMFDHAYASLLEDLHDRGLLQNTLVLAMGEFGRTPKVNPAGGRDHWTNCWTILMGGGGIKGGQVIGASDEIGGYPRDRPIAPPDVAATIYKALGIDIETPIIGPANRPVPVVDYGHDPINELF